MLDKVLSRMALNLDKIMDLSLDDYIAISKASNNSEVVSNKHDRITFKGNNEKFGRRKGNIDDEDEDDEDEDGLLLQTAKVELEEDIYDKSKPGIWRGPDSSISYLDCNDRGNDLREKLYNNSNNILESKISAVQYRLMAPNNSARRPRGISTLLPLDVEMQNRNCIPSKDNKRKSKNCGNRRYNSIGRNFNNTNNNELNRNSGFGREGVNNGRIQKYRKNEIESKNLRFSVGRNNYQNKNVNNANKAQNIIIKTPTNIINLKSSPPLNSSFQIAEQVTSQNHTNGFSSPHLGNLTPQAKALLNLNSEGCQNSSSTAGSSNESLKNLLGFRNDVSSEMMPLFASRLMDYIQQGLQNHVVHKPVYDMKIQKDIHELQRKPLLYNCPGGNVVSFDGAGVNCKIIPRTSGVSLNCRFA